MDALTDLTTSAEARLGSSLRGKYLLERLLGVGGMAAVYEATHRNGMRVAVKVLHRELARMSQIKARFLREGYAANRIGHPGVVRVLDDDEDADGSAFIAMELLEGETLEKEWARSNRKLPLPRVVGVLDELLEVLDAAHAAGVIHRDVKPDNIFITRGGSLKILDFGIARLVDNSRVTSSGEMMGTPEFVSPEQAGGRVREIDGRADIFSVGAIAFTLLSGTFVQEGTTSLERMIYAATRPSRKIHEVLPELHADVAHVIDVALSFELKDRFANARAMRAALQGAASNAGVATKPSPPQSAQSSDGERAASPTSPASPSASGTSTAVMGSQSGPKRD
jgi:serine/threonine-protein kinase